MDKGIDWERFAEDIFTWLWLQFRLSPQSVPDPQKGPNAYDNPLILKTVVRAVNINQLLCRKAFNSLFEIQVNSSVALLQTEEGLFLFMSEVIQDLFQKSERGGTYDVFTRVILSLTVPTEIVLFLENKGLQTFIRNIPRLWNLFFASRLSEEFADRGGLTKLQEHIDQTSDALPHLNNFISKHGVPYTEEDLFAKYRDFVASWEQSGSGLRPVEIAKALKEATEEKTKEYQNFRGYLWEYHPRFGLYPHELKLAEEIFRNPVRSEDFLQKLSNSLSPSERKIQRHIKIKSIWLLFHQIFLSDPVAKAEADAEYAAAVEAAAAAAVRAGVASGTEDDDDEDEPEVGARAEGGAEADTKVMTEAEVKAAAEEAVRKRKVAIIKFLRKKLSANRSAASVVRLPGSSPWPLDRRVQTHIKLKSQWLRCQQPFPPERKEPGSRAEAAIAAVTYAEESEGKALKGENSPMHKKEKFRSDDYSTPLEEKLSEMDLGKDQESKTVKVNKVALSKKKKKDKRNWKPKDKTVLDNDGTDKGQISTGEKCSEKEDLRKEGELSESPGLEKTEVAKLEAEISQSSREITVQEKDILISEREEIKEKDCRHVPGEMKSQIEESPTSKRSKDAKLKTEISIRPKERTVQDKDSLVSEEEKAITEKIDRPMPEKKETKEGPEAKKTKDDKSEIEVGARPKQKTVQNKDSLVAGNEKTVTEKVGSPLSEKGNAEESPGRIKTKERKSETELSVRPKTKVKKELLEDKPLKYMPSIEFAIQMEEHFFAEQYFRRTQLPAEIPTSVPEKLQESIEARRETRKERLSTIRPTPPLPYFFTPETRTFFDRFAEDVFAKLCGYFKVPAKFFHKTTNKANDYHDDIVHVVARSVCVNQLMLRSWFYKYFADAMQDEDFKFLESPNKVIILICDAIFDLFNMTRKSTTTIFHMFVDSLTVPMELILFLQSRNLETQTEYFPVCWKVFFTFELLCEFTRFGGFEGFRKIAEDHEYAETLLEPYINERCIPYTGEELWEQFSDWLYEDSLSCSLAAREKEVADSYLEGLIPNPSTALKVHKKKKGKRKK